MGGVTAYRQVPHSSGTYDKIHGVVREAISKLKAELGDDDKPVIVMAHSMGSVIMSNYIYDRQKKYQPEDTRDEVRADGYIGRVYYLWQSHPPSLRSPMIQSWLSNSPPRPCPNI